MNKNELLKRPAKVKLVLTERSETDPKIRPDMVYAEIHRDQSQFANLSVEAAAKDVIRRAMEGPEPNNKTVASTFHRFYEITGGNVKYYLAGTDRPIPLDSNEARKRTLSDFLLPYTDPATGKEFAYAEISISSPPPDKGAAYEGSLTGGLKWYYPA